MFFVVFNCWVGFFVFNKRSHPLQVWRCLSLLMLEGDPLVTVTWRNPLQGPTQASQGCFILLRKLSPLRGSLRALWQELAFLRGQAPRKEVLAQIRSEMKWMLGAPSLQQEGCKVEGVSARPPVPMAALSLTVTPLVPPPSCEVPGRAERGGGATNHPNQPVGVFYRHQMVLIEES